MYCSAPEGSVAGIDGPLKEPLNPGPIDDTAGGSIEECTSSVLDRFPPKGFPPLPE